MKIADLSIKKQIYLLQILMHDIRMSWDKGKTRRILDKRIWIRTLCRTDYGI